MLKNFEFGISGISRDYAIIGQDSFVRHYGKLNFYNNIIGHNLGQNYNFDSIKVGSLFFYIFLSFEFAGIQEFRQPLFFM